MTKNSDKFYKLLKKVVNKYALNEMEEDVLTCVCKGMEEKEIMKQLKVTKSKVNLTKRDMYIKMDVGNNPRTSINKILSIVIYELTRDE